MAALADVQPLTNRRTKFVVRPSNRQGGRTPHSAEHSAEAGQRGCNVVSRPRLVQVQTSSTRVRTRVLVLG